MHLTDSIGELLRTACAVHGVAFDNDNPEVALALLGIDGHTVASGLRHAAHPTLIQAGYQGTVIPSSARAELDCRYLPGRWEEFLGELKAALGDAVELQVLAKTLGLTAGGSDERAAVMRAALSALQFEDPSALVSPHLSGGTDATHFQKLGITCLGLSPIVLPRVLDFWSLFHGVDERIPVNGLAFGTRVLDHFLRAY